MSFECMCEFWRVWEFDVGVGIWNMECLAVFFYFLFGMRRESVIGVSLSDEVIEAVEGRRGLVKLHLL